MSVEIALSEARANLTDVVNRTFYARERIVLKRRGRSVAAIVPVDDLALLERLEDQFDLETARAALSDPNNQGGTPFEDVLAEAGATQGPLEPGRADRGGPRQVG